VLFARPSGGFNIIETPEVSRRIGAAIADWPALAHGWAALKARLALVGHREGTKVDGEGAGYFVISTDCLGLPGLPEVTALYQILGSDLRLLSVLIRNGAE